MIDEATYSRLISENARLSSYTKQLEQDLAKEKEDRLLFSSFTHAETKAIVKFMKDWKDARKQDFSESARIINQRRMK